MENQLEENEMEIVSIMGYFGVIWGYKIRTPKSCI